MDCCSGKNKARENKEYNAGNGKSDSGKNWVAIIAIIMIIVMVASTVLR